MKESKFTESQIVAILRECDAWVPLANRTRKHGICRAELLRLADDVTSCRALRLALQVRRSMRV